MAASVLILEMRPNFLKNLRNVKLPPVLDRSLPLLLYYYMRLFQNFSFWNSFLELVEKPGRTLGRFNRFFQELVPKPCALAHSRLVLEQAHYGYYYG
jgi:hypothetical protein